MKLAIAIAIILTILGSAGYLTYEFIRTSPATAPAPTTSLAPATATSTIAPASPLEQSQQLVIATEELIKSGALTATSTDNDRKILFLRSPQNVAKYFSQTGSEDSVATYHLYYDTNSRLRAAIIKGGAVNGSKLHHAIYFDSDGTTRLSEEQLYESGIEYSWPKVWPEKLLIRDPYADFTR